MSSFSLKVSAMVDSMHLSELQVEEFYSIYNEYGERMKNAYENRTSWARLNHIYQWSVRDRDTKLKAILSPEQLTYFKKRQREIERESREEKRNST